MVLPGHPHVRHRGARQVEVSLGWGSLAGLPGEGEASSRTPGSPRQGRSPSRCHSPPAPRAMKTDLRHTPAPGSSPSWGPFLLPSMPSLSNLGPTLSHPLCSLSWHDLKLHASPLGWSASPLRAWGCLGPREQGAPTLNNTGPGSECEGHSKAQNDLPQVDTPTRMAPRLGSPSLSGERAARWLQRFISWGCWVSPESFEEASRAG